MAPKQVLDKQAWQWAEQTDLENITMQHILTAYRINIALCPLNRGICRKNCMGNPNCFNNLGERQWMEKNLEEELNEADFETNVLREPGSFIGLKNLGATCYVNTFLQVWFHNLEFRRGILEWRDDNQLTHPDNHSSSSDAPDDEVVQPHTVLGHLQLLFALLSYSERPFIDPSPFIQCLQLDTSLQQDAQEFSKLFTSLLEEQLPGQDKYHGLNLIQHEFVGHYEYITRCSGCGQQSRSGSKFYEIDLNIKDHLNFSECLEEFLREEKLDGENQYRCQYCLQKQDAVRRIHLLDLPPTLNFQLLRFVYDRQTQSKKKLSSYLVFPEVLDMNEYISQTGNATEGNTNLIYDLVSVLVHRGLGAHSGHYVAVIKDSKTHATFRFNDEEVVKLADDRFRLEPDEDSDGSTQQSKVPQKKPRPAKGFLFSRNAYMLVYRRRGTQKVDEYDEVSLENLPVPLQRFVDSDNAKQIESLRDQFETRKFYIGKEQERQDMINQFYNQILFLEDSKRDNDSFEWLSRTWMTKWLKADAMDTVEPVDNSHLLCPHEKLHPDNVVHAKLVPRDSADIVFGQFNGGPRLPCIESLCRKCVEEKCYILRSKAKITDDHKLISAALKLKDLVQNEANCYWVGKESLKNWKGLAQGVLDELTTATWQNGNAEQDQEMDDGASKDNVSEKEATDNEHEMCTGNGDHDVVAMDTSEQRSDVAQHIPSEATPLDNDAAAAADAVADANSTDEKRTWLFNEDLLCTEHDDLNPDLTVMRLIPERIWLQLKHYFPKAREFPFASDSCHLCKLKDERVKQSKEKDRAMAAEQKLRLANLFSDKRRPSPSDDGISDLNIINCQFVEEWRKFIKDPVKYAVPDTIDNRSLLCDHGYFLYNVNAEDSLNVKYTYIWPDEWNILRTYVESDIEIRVMKIQEDSGIVSLVVSPDFCKNCCDERKLAEYSSQFSYDSATVYVRKVTDGTMPMFANTLGSSSKPLPSVAPPPLLDAGDAMAPYDSDESEVVNENGKRKCAVSEQGEKVPRIDTATTSASTAFRRSTRKARVRDEIKLDVSSTQTVRELKMQLVKEFSVLKMDQHLYLEGKELCDENATLEQLQIPPLSIFYLKTDEPSTETTFLDIPTGNSIEEGFKGTGLVGR